MARDAGAGGGGSALLTDYALFSRLGEGLDYKVAIRFGDRGYTYREVAERARGVAGALAAAGIGPGARVAIALPDAPPFAWSLFGALSAGAAVAMKDPRAPAGEIAFAIDYARPEAVVTTPEVAGAIAGALARAPALREVYVAPDVATGEDPEAEAEFPAELREAGIPVEALARAAGGARGDPDPRRAPRPDDPALWLLTSGSSGRPKAAVHAHRDLVAHAELYGARAMGYRQSDVTVSAPRLGFGYATGTNLIFPLAAGATVGLFSEPPTAEALSEAAARYGATVVTNVPTVIAKLLDLDQARAERGEPGLTLGRERFHISAGEALPPGLKERFERRFGVPVYDGIGSAETFHIFATNRPGDEKPGSLGRAVEGVELAILPEGASEPGGERLSPGEVGELWVRAPAAAMGYAGDREASARTFFGRWVRTGDLAWIDREGYLYYRGRADSRFKASGVWVAPAEVEACLASHPAVGEAGVVPLEREDGLVKPQAFVVPSRSGGSQLGGEADRRALADALRAHVRAELGAAVQPRHIEFVAELPRTDRGKLDRAALARRGP